MSLESFITVSPDSHFPIQNLPFGIFSTEQNPLPRMGVAIGDYVLDLSELLRSSAINQRFQLQGITHPLHIFSQTSLNAFMSLGPKVWRGVREFLQHILSKDTPLLRDDQETRTRAFNLLSTVAMHIPANIGDYTDFYASREHATNVGTMFRGPANALQPNWVHLPVGYHGRASSIVVSDTNIRRPQGQRLPSKDAKVPVFGPSVKMDFELEVAFLVGVGNELGEPVRIDKAKDHIFGVVLMNDWSARDIQSWEYVPLGPFLGKNFGTTISPWVVTMDALEPFLTPGPVQDPNPLPYLREEGSTAYDVHLEVHMKASGSEHFSPITRSNLKYMYWSFTQQLAHHTINGCNLRTGDLCGSGTISGATHDSLGSLLELTHNGTQPIILDTPTGKISRYFIENGDEIRLTGWCQHSENYKIGFGTCDGKLI